MEEEDVFPEGAKAAAPVTAAARTAKESFMVVQRRGVRGNLLW
jgi:hypothetical protein